MSYILDALRKADAQRERDPARGIHAQPTPLASASAMQGAASTRWLWIAGIAGVAVIGGAVWYLGGGDKTAAPAAATVTAPASVAPAPARPPMMLPTPAAPSVQPPPPPPQTARMTPPRDPTNSSVPPMRGMPQTNLVPSNPPASPAAARAAAADAAAASAAGVPARPAISAPAQPAPAPAAQAQAATGLPPDAPKLVITGGVYSPSAAQRMLIVNGQVFNEGSEVAPGVTVEEIKARTAVLKFRGTRYTVAY